MQTPIKDLMKRALKHSTAEYCEIRVEETTETAIRIRGKDIEAVAQNVSAGGNVRALYRGGWGFISFNRLDDLEKKVRKPAPRPGFSGRLNKDIKLYPVEPVEDYVPGNFKRGLRSASQGQDGPPGRYNKLILGCPEITSSSIGYFDRHTRHFANSEGTYIYQEKMDLGGGLAAIATKDKLTTQDSARFGSNNDYNVALGLEDEVREAAEAARQMLYAPVVEAGQYTVILDRIWRPLRPRSLRAFE